MSIAHSPQPEMTIQVRSLHKTRFFWIANEVYDRYAPTLGFECLGLYAALARYAHNHTGQCWPSLARLSREGKIAQERVAEHLQTLVQAGLIAIEDRPGKPLLISLLDVSAAPWVPAQPPACPDMTAPLTPVDAPPLPAPLRRRDPAARDR